MSKEFYFVDRLQNLLQKSLKEVLLLCHQMLSDVARRFPGVDRRFPDVAGSGLTRVANLLGFSFIAINNKIRPIYCNKSNKIQ